MFNLPKKSRNNVGTKKIYASFLVGFQAYPCAGFKTGLGPKHWHSGTDLGGGFKHLYMFTLKIWGNDPNFGIDSYFSNGLKPPTRDSFFPVAYCSFICGNCKGPECLVPLSLAEQCDCNATLDTIFCHVFHKINDWIFLLHFSEEWSYLTFHIVATCNLFKMFWSEISTCSSFQPFQPFTFS